MKQNISAAVLTLVAATVCIVFAISNLQADDDDAENENIEIGGDLELTEWASYPLLANPVALAVDDRGNIYVTETARRKTSNLDIREHRQWMTEDLSFQSIEDKRAFLHERLAPDRSDEHEWLEDRNGDGSRDWRDLTVQSEKIHRLTDTDGDGTADSSIIFADGFQTEVTGVAAGVLPVNSDVYAAIAPDLWRLEDTDGDGIADDRESLAHGFGVHFGYAGHDMSGVTLGPDGKIYWSIGDIGVNVTDQEGRQWKYPNQGAVMRANPDGSEFEVFARGLRNTQELAFDTYGNLISVDNDGDRSGEHERIVYITEDSDAGWRMNWQFGKYSAEDNSNYVVWMEEELYKPHFEGQAAYITPPVAAYHDGPAGFAHNPGTALGESWKNHFFVSLFTGSAAGARLHAFTLEPDGASFALKEDRQVLEGVLATGISFSPEGALYLADWGEGWNIGEKGRIWKLDTPEEKRSQLQRETARLLREGMSGRADEEVSRLLQHEDMRVRMRAQFELVDRGNVGRQKLLEAARQTEHQLMRLHGIWGIGQLGRKQPEIIEPLLPLLDDNDPEVRAQVAKVLGEAEYRPARDHLISLLEDPRPRPKFFAAIALGRLEAGGAFEPIIGMIAESGGDDPYLRHAGITGLTRLADPENLARLKDHESKNVRLAAVVALRRLRDDRVADFLHDEDPRVVVEAARAIHDDFSIPNALPALAEVLEREEPMDEPLLRRSINANLRLGAPEHARRLATFAGRTSASGLLRAEALESLGMWPDPSPLDRVTGRYRVMEPRDTAAAREAVESLFPSIWDDPSDTVRVEAAEMVAHLDIRESSPQLLRVVQTVEESPSVRRAALRTLVHLQDERMSDAIETALASEQEGLRREAVGFLSDLELSDQEMAAMYGTVLETGTIGQKQSALRALGNIDTPSAHELLKEWMIKLIDGQVEKELQLDLLEAVRSADSDELEELYTQYESAKPDTKMAAYRETLYGGNVRDGREIVFEHSTAQCVRCHAIDGEGGTVGPPLGEFGAQADREYILESLIAPSETLAPGYGTTTLSLEDGRTVSGTVQLETDRFIIVEQSDGSTERIMKENLEERSTTPSAMPSMENILSKKQIRDVVEYLANLD